MFAPWIPFPPWGKGEGTAAFHSRPPSLPFAGGNSQEQIYSVGKPLLVYQEAVPMYSIPSWSFASITRSIASKTLD